MRGPASRLSRCQLARGSYVQPISSAQARVRYDVSDIRRNAFEEICAKTLYNISGHIKGREFPYPFDDDSPFWVFPIAVGFARALGLPDPYSVSSLLQPPEDG